MMGHKGKQLITTTTAPAATTTTTTTTTTTSFRSRRHHCERVIWGKECHMGLAMVPLDRVLLSSCSNCNVALQVFLERPSGFPVPSPQTISQFKRWLQQCTVINKMNHPVFKYLSTLFLRSVPN